jgi:hypothetical protein
MKCVPNVEIRKFTLCQFGCLQKGCASYERLRTYCHEHQVKVQFFNLTILKGRFEVEQFHKV